MDKKNMEWVFICLRVVEKTIFLQENFRYMKTITSIFFLLMLCYCSMAQPTGINRIDKEQKLYELSLIWKELTYNFANMDNCPDVHLDSLYRKYIPIVQNTKNDFEYYKALQHFLAHLNNGHTAIYKFPDYFDDYLGFILLRTAYKDNKIIVENIGAHNAKKINIGDEIVSINGMPAIDYFQKHVVSYIAASNEEAKTLERAMFGKSNYINIALKDEKIKLRVKTPAGIKKVTLAYDCYMKPLPKDTATQKNKRFLKGLTHVSAMKNNYFLEDTTNGFAYIRLTRCNDDFYNFFAENYDKIMKHENLIVDVHYNEGGSSHPTDLVAHYLINNDTIYQYSEKTRIHNALFKAHAAIKIWYYEDDEVSEYDKEKWYPHYYNTAFEEVEPPGYPNDVPDSMRYKGKVYLLIGQDNGSAGEHFVITLSQNKDITILGKKTMGAIAQPLLVVLPSGIEVLINTMKTYDFRGIDTSSGFPPDYEYDFSEIYKIENPQEMLRRLIEVIKGLE